MKHRAERTLFPQDDREHRQAAELADALMSDEPISVEAEPFLASLSAFPLRALISMKERPR
jgi:hypothetical protein